MSQYFEYDPSLKEEDLKFSYTFKGNVLNFISNSGVFSKTRVDFGTNVLLNSLGDLNTCNSILDLGCGIGIIGLCLKKYYNNINIDMVDINEKCIALSKKNMELNKVNTNIYLSDMYANINAKYDCIISNPPIRAGKAKVFEVVDGALTHLNQNGKLIVVIQKKQGAESMKKHMEEVFKNVNVITKEKGYFVLESLYN